MRKSKKIITEYGGIASLAKEFEVTRITVNSALNFVTRTELADQIRKAAKKKYGGKIINHTV